MKLIRILLIFFIQAAHCEPIILCDVSKGLDLINRETYSSEQIEMILNSCDKVSPQNPSVLLLHGLLARKNKQNLAAIEWFEKAKSVAPEDQPIILELATTYELVKQTAKAEQLYQSILLKSPHNRAALLGMARILRLEGNFNQAVTLYQTLLTINPQDVDALNGLGWVKTAQNDLLPAKNFFNETLKIQPQNLEALLALNKIKETELQQSGPTTLCNASYGLLLVNQNKAPLAQIKAILNSCTLNKIENRDTQLLNGLLARKEVGDNKNYATAISWLQKAVKSAGKNDYIPELELAITYEWSNKAKDAQIIYNHILEQDPENRGAVLGKARVLRTLKQFNEAQNIYKQLISKNSKDVDAINGLGWIALAQRNLNPAMDFFRKSLSIQPTNKEALWGLENSRKATIQPPIAVKPPSLCDDNAGLILLNQTNPPLNKINAILIRCDKNTPNATSTLLLHGLLARYLAKPTQNYNSAIAWLIKANQNAEPNNDTPALELAVTYEWAGNFNDALIIYEDILSKRPNNKIALIGKARALRFSYQINPSIAIYEQLLKRYPNDTEALSGEGEAYLANYEFDKARTLFNKVLDKNPGNKQVASDLQLLNNATKNILDLSVGHYTVPPNTSDGLNLYYFRNLNATDGLTVLGTHNTRQIESGFGTGAALLPNNSLLLGYQRIIPNKYSWQVSYDARQHDRLPFENRLYGSTSFNLQRNLAWFGGVRLAFPDQWNTQLLISGFNLYTSLPVNITVTGFWAFQQIGGYNSSYALDFAKEYNSHLFYDFGPSYLVEQKSWEAHGKLIFPVFKNQAVVVQGSHFFFNNSTFINLGWRLYWA